MSLSTAPQVVLGDLVGMAIGTTLGVVLRAAAIVGYFVVSFVLPGILARLALVQEWFLDLQPWIDWSYTQGELFGDATNTGEERAMLGSTTMTWIVIPLVVGMLFLRRSEVKKPHTRAAVSGAHLFRIPPFRGGSAQRAIGSPCWCEDPSAGYVRATSPLHAVQVR